jgi:hypothetical protein
MSERSERIIRHVVPVRSTGIAHAHTAEVGRHMSERSERIIRHVVSARSAEQLMRIPPKAVST